MWGSRRYEFVVSTYQMVVLVLFNSHDRLKFSDIVTMTQIPPDELRRHLVSMAVSQFRILIKERRSRDVADDDVFFVNPEYKSKLARVKVPLVSLKEQAEEAVPEPVMEDRRHLCVLLARAARVPALTLLTLLTPRACVLPQDGGCDCADHEGPQDAGPQQLGCGGDAAACGTLPTRADPNQAAH